MTWVRKQRQSAQCAAPITCPRSSAIDPAFLPYCCFPRGPIRSDFFCIVRVRTLNYPAFQSNKNATFRGVRTLTLGQNVNRVRQPSACH